MRIDLIYGNMILGYVWILVGELFDVIIQFRIYEGVMILLKIVNISDSGYIIGGFLYCVGTVGTVGVGIGVGVVGAIGCRVTNYGPGARPGARPGPGTRPRLYIRLCI